MYIEQNKFINAPISGFDLDHSIVGDRNVNFVLVNRGSTVTIFIQNTN